MVALFALLAVVVILVGGAFLMGTAQGSFDRDRVHRREQFEAARATRSAEDNAVQPTAPRTLEEIRADYETRLFWAHAASALRLTVARLEADATR